MNTAQLDRRSRESFSRFQTRTRRCPCTRLSTQGISAFAPHRRFRFMRGRRSSLVRRIKLQPLGFFSKSFDETQQKYSAYGRPSIIGHPKFSISFRRPLFHNLHRPDTVGLGFQTKENYRLGQTRNASSMSMEKKTW